MTIKLVSRVCGILLLMISISEGDNLINGPEGIVYDTTFNRYLVSNWSDGSVIEIDSNGNHDVFCAGLGNGAGIHIHEDIVWVCCSNQRLKGFDLESGLERASLNLSSNGLHDVCTDTSGYLYATNFNGPKLYKVDLSDYSWESTTLWGVPNPGGIVFDAAQIRLLICGFDSDGRITSVDPNTMSYSTATITPFSDMDDLAIDTMGHIFITTWNVNDTWAYDSAFSIDPICIGNGPTMMTDICYNPEANELAVTHYNSSMISFYSLNDNDGDGSPDAMDNCPDSVNAGQIDGDEDGIGDVCDNCPVTPNSSQANSDDDELGDSCDNCPDTENSDQLDVDEDQVGDACDNCPQSHNSSQTNDDTDSLGNACDNCPDTENNDQADMNANQIGDVCEPCCGFWSDGYTGNVNQSPDGKVTLSDVTMVIDYVYITKEPFDCPENGNTNADLQGAITLSDITRMIDHVYISKTATEYCP